MPTTCSGSAGDYRIIFESHDDKLLVLVVRLAHRSVVYARQRR